MSCAGPTKRRIYLEPPPPQKDVRPHVPYSSDNLLHGFLPPVPVPRHSPSTGTCPLPCPTRFPSSCCKDLRPKITLEEEEEEEDCSEENQAREAGEAEGGREGP